MVLLLGFGLAAPGWAAGENQPGVARPRGRRDAANTPNALMRGGPTTPAPVPAPSTPVSAGEATHLPSGSGASSGPCKKPPGRRLTRLALKPDAELGDVLAWISALTCKQFLLPGTIPANSKKVTLIVPRPIEINEAYQLFLASLDAVGLTVEPNGAFLRIIETSKAKSSLVPLYLGSAAKRPRPATVTRLVRIEHAGADQAAARLDPFKSENGDIVVATPTALIITDAAANVDRMLAALHEIDRAPETP